MTIGLTIAAAGLVSYGLRSVPGRWATRRPLPPAWVRRLDLLGPAAFAALAAPAVVHGAGIGAPTAARLTATATAAVAARTTRSTAATLAVGMPTLWLVTAVTAR